MDPSSIIIICVILLIGIFVGVRALEKATKDVPGSKTIIGHLLGPILVPIIGILILIIIFLSNINQ